MSPASRRRASGACGWAATGARGAIRTRATGAATGAA